MIQYGMHGTEWVKAFGLFNPITVVIIVTAINRVGSTPARFVIFIGCIITGCKVNKFTL